MEGYKKMKKGNITALAITVIIGVIVVGVVFGLLTTQTETTAITDDQFAVSNTSCVKVTNNCLVDGTASFENATGSTTIGADNFTGCYTSGELNGFIMAGTASTEAVYNGETINTTYEERSCQYIGGTAGTIVNYVPMLLAVMLLAFVAGYSLILKP